jgi:hypothetical protein
MENPIDYNIPCDNCIIFPRCIEPNRFSDTFYGCQCPMLEQWISDFNKKHNEPDGSEIKGTFAVVDWYQAKTGIKI